MTEEKHNQGAWALWLFVSLMFLMVIGAWVTVITLSNKHPTERIGLTDTP